MLCENDVAVSWSLMLEAQTATPLSIQQSFVQLAAKRQYRRNKSAHIPVLILVFLVDATHERSGRWQDLIDEDEDSLLWGQLDALADYVDKLSDCEICWNKVLLLVDGCDI